MPQSCHSLLADDLIQATRGHLFWTDYLKLWQSETTVPYSIHLAIFVEPFLQYVLEKRKTVESRFSINRCAPYNQVKQGDVLLLKKSGGPIVGLCMVSQAWFYQLDPASWQDIRSQFTEALCAQDPAFWEQRQRACFASLMRVGNVCPIPPIPFIKHDRRGWVVLQKPDIATSLIQEIE